MFVQRDEFGKINGCFGCRQPGSADEELSDDHPDVLAYFNPPNAAIDRQIALLEGAPHYLSRAVREFTLAQILYNHLRDVHDAAQPMSASSELKAQGVTELSTAGPYFNKGFANMKSLDDQIRALRAQRT